MLPINWNVTVIKGVGWLLSGVEKMEIEKPEVEFSQLFWYSKKGIFDAFCDALATSPPFTWYPRPTLMTLTRVLNMKLTPHPWRTHMYHHLVAVVLVYLTTETFRPTLQSVNCLIGFLTEQPVYGDAFWQTLIYGWKKCQLPHTLINWPIYGDGDGPCLLQIPYINIHLSIDQ